MQWLESAFQGESTGLTLTIIVVGLTLALILLFWIFRKIAGGATRSGKRSRQPRLGIAEVMRVDDKRRLVLVRRDDVEHLVMIGGGSDFLVESRIGRPGEQASRQAGEPEISSEPEPVDENRVVPIATAAAAASAGRIEQERDEWPEPAPPPAPSVVAEPEPPIRQSFQIRSEDRYEKESAEAPATEMVSQSQSVASNPDLDLNEEPQEAERQNERDSDDVEFNAEFERQEFSARPEEEPEQRKEPVPEKDERQSDRPKQSTSSDVEDEMQRLLDELSSR